MKYFFKGIFLGFATIISNRLCSVFFGGLPDKILLILSALVFFIVVTSFLISDKVYGLFICGFTGMFIMFAYEITHLFSDLCFSIIAYIGGLFGTLASIIAALTLSCKRIKISSLFLKEDINMSTELKNDLKIKLLIYTLISAISFSYLVLPENAGISVPIFVLIQFIFMFFIAPNRKKLWLSIPMFIFSLNCFCSANTIWRFSNLIIGIIIQSSMFLDFSFKDDSLTFISNIGSSFFTPFAYFNLPVKWTLEINSDKSTIVKRVLLALCIAVPCVIILTLVLSSADMVFSLKVNNLFSNTSNILTFNTIFKIVCGIAVGLFLFGTIYHAHTNNITRPEKERNIKGDLIIINILLSSLLIVYTLFVVIQFKYLFAGSSLPNGLTYTDYARKGFFELLALTFVNIVLILTSIKLTKKSEIKWSLLTKIFCHYLCAVTLVLLISSFYRMFLYTNDDGLTRLRFFVMGFLIFEAIGLLITFLYIAKPKFNICLMYTIIALVYYMILNIIPTDNIIAKNQIDKYLENERDDLAYIFTLSADAAPAIEFLLDNTTDNEMIEEAYRFLRDVNKPYLPPRWQRYNLSTERATKIFENRH